METPLILQVRNGRTYNFYMGKEREVVQFTEDTKKLLSIHYICGRCQVTEKQLQYKY